MKKCLVHAVKVREWCIAEQGTKIVAVYEFLEQYGFCFENVEYLQLINGTHELYIREEENE